jgi:tetratricopeptide (TPR) repeat protein
VIGSDARRHFDVRFGWRYSSTMSTESSRRRWTAVMAAVAGLGLAWGALSYEARAQQPPPPADPPVAPEAIPAPPADADAPASRLADRIPSTADEKSKLLGDLYAHLAAADSAEAAKKVQATIERLWTHSGSDTVSLLMQRASKALGAKDHDTAIKFLDYVVLLAPDYAEGFNRRAYIHFARNDLASAVGDLRRTLALEPNHFRALDGLAQIWRQTGNAKGALNVVKQLLEVHPYWEGAERMADDLAREVEGQGI